ncbi:hypothetical protein HA44_02685 [Mixta gaviniae]|nr:hypothetical protein HA44_02685 [Mixta gaviniae]
MKFKFWICFAKISFLLSPLRLKRKRKSTEKSGQMGRKTNRQAFGSVEIHAARYEKKCDLPR